MKNVKFGDVLVLDGTLRELGIDTELPLSECLAAVEEKYGVTLDNELHPQDLAYQLWQLSSGGRK